MSQMKTKLWLSLNNCHYPSHSMSRKLNCAIIFMNNKHGINSLIEFGQDSASVINGIKKPPKTTLCSLRTLLVGLFCGVYHNISEEHYSHVLRWVPRCSSHACAHGPFLLCMHAPPASVCLSVPVLHYPAVRLAMPTATRSWLLWRKLHQLFLSKQSPSSSWNCMLPSAVMCVTPPVPAADGDSKAHHCTHV